MKIFSSEEIRAIDKYTIEQEGISAKELVDRVGKGVADEILDRWGIERRIVVFAGWGNNGADALSASRVLAEAGADVTVYLFNIGGERLSADCKECRDELKEACPQVNLIEVVKNFEMPELTEDMLIIDGLFGSGLNKPLPGSLVMIIHNINDSEAPVVSIDIPSGLYSDWNSHLILRNVVHATLTLAVEFPRLSFFIPDNSEVVGEWKLLKIGLSREAIKKTPYTYYLITDRDIKRILRRRDPDSSKADYGSALICAGSYGMCGAAVLALRGALRAGAGKVTCYGPRCAYFVAQTAVPSAMFIRDPHDNNISEITLEREYSAIGIGPGIGTRDVTINALENFLKLANANHQALVIDADALNCIAVRPIMLNYLPTYSVLTPHAGEFDRLFGSQPSAEARLRKAIDVARFYNVIIVLKGRYTAVVRPDGKVHINSSGTPALATPGSGDVLTGVITALIAQGYRPETAAISGVYVHGLAGELAENQHGSYGVTAEDIALEIGRAIKIVME